MNPNESKQWIGRGRDEAVNASVNGQPQISSYAIGKLDHGKLDHRSGQPRKRRRASGCIVSKSSNVRKSIVLKCRSSAGGPQIFAPRVK